MIRFAFPVATMLALAACGTQSGPPPIDMNKVAAAVTEAQRLCRYGAPVIAIAAAIPDPRVSVPALAVSAMCGALLSGQVPANFDANTPAWLAQNLADLAKLVGK